MKKNYVKITLDSLMALTFALLMDPQILNGLPFHEIAGLVFGVAILTHISLNIKWVIQTTSKIFDSKLPKKTQFNYLLNILLLFSMATVIVTGILISRVVFPNLGISGSRSFKGIHNLFANLTLVLVGLHIGVHWQWIMSIFKRIFKSKEGKVRIGSIVSVVVVVSVLVAGIQWFASTSSNTSDFNPKQMQQESNTQSSNNGTSKSNNQIQSNSISIPNFQVSPSGEFRGHDDGKFGGAKSPFLIILQYLAIFAIITIPTYYIEKRIMRKKRKS